MATKANSINFFLPLTMVAVAWLVWLAWPTHYFFLNDDFIHVPLAAQNVIGHRNSIRFVGDLSLAIDSLIYGKNAMGFHLTNLLLHLANMALVFAVTTQLISNRNPTHTRLTPWAAAILFGVFAFHSDGIFWVIGRSASLGMLFSMVMWLTLMKVREKPWLGIVSLLCWIAALFSYESGWVMPVVVTLWLLQQKRHSATTLSVINIWIVFGVYLYFRKQATGEWLGSYEAWAFADMDISTLASNYLKLLCRTWLPPIQAKWQFAVLAACTGLLHCIAAYYLIAGKKLTNTWSLLTVCWLSSYLPYLSLGISISGYESERYLYLPSFFWSAWAAYTILSLYPKRTFQAQIILAAIIAYHAVFLYFAAGTWKAAGSVSKQTFYLINNLPENKSLCFENLPGTVQGIPVFRLGLEEGLEWLAKPHISKGMQIKSRQDYSTAILSISKQDKDTCYIISYAPEKP